MVPSRLRYQSVSCALWGSSPFFLPHIAGVNGFYMINYISQLQREKESSSDYVGGGKEWLKQPACHLQQMQTFQNPFPLLKQHTCWEAGWYNTGMCCDAGLVPCSTKKLSGCPEVPKCLRRPPAQQGGCEHLLISRKTPLRL